MHFISGKKIRNICIIGGGNVGHFLIATIGSNPSVSVRLLTSTPEKFRDRIESYDVDHDVLTVGALDVVSSDPEKVIPDSDMLIFAVPSNAYNTLLKKVYPYTTEGTILGFVPGTGGIEFLFKDFIKNKRCSIWGSQRVPSGTKVVEKGVRVESLGNRKDIRIGSIPNCITTDVCSIINDLIGITTVELPNYLSVTFTPSNPILHTSRLYGLFHDYAKGDSWKNRLSLYSNWDDYSSDVLIGADSELKECIARLSRYDLSNCLSLIDHYEINDEVPGVTLSQKMTNKIRSLRYLKDYAPMCKNEIGEWIPDFKSRYFTEDFPFGLCILEDFCSICGVNAVHMQKVLNWGGLFVPINRDDLPLPSMHGLNSVDDIYKYYDDLEKEFNPGDL